MELEKAKVLVAKLAKEHKIDVQNAWDMLFFDANQFDVIFS